VRAKRTCPKPLDRGATEADAERMKGGLMTPLLVLAVVMMLLGAVMLVTGVGASAIWIAVVTVGIAIVVIERNRGRHGVNT
jgi:hypothetical protein